MGLRDWFLSSTPRTHTEALLAVFKEQKGEHVGSVPGGRSGCSISLLPESGKQRSVPPTIDRLTLSESVQELRTFSCFVGSNIVNVEILFMLKLVVKARTDSCS